MVNIRNVYKTYDNNIVLNDLSYDFEDKETYYIRGLSGAGKTTLINIIYGYEKPDKGIIDLNNSIIEYMLQEPLVFSNLTVKENMVLKKSAKKGELCLEDDIYRKALDKVYLSHISLDKKVSTLSGGELQRLQLAQYMLTNPDVIILDEPACKLDKEHRLMIYQLINDIFCNAIKIVITHDEEALEVEGIKLELKEGKLWKI